MDFDARYAKLNKDQRTAVDIIDGPVMVIAGPGTGKTELLSMRVANILRQTDTLPENIVCLTFTESGAHNMRERLTRLIGQASHKVNIGTYHSFGGDLIKRFPEYFAETRLNEPVDTLVRHQIIAEIVDKMSYANPLKQSSYYLNDLIGTISEVKRALLTSDDLRAIAAENATFIQTTSRATATIFADMPRTTKLATALPYYEKILHTMRLSISPTKHGHIVPLANIASESLQTAIENAIASNKTTPLTEWKNKWLKKNVNNAFIVGGELENIKVTSLADVLDQYRSALETRGLYDFDDMIIRSIQVLEKNDDLKYTLQEQYQYLLLDEFQDTNAVQLRMVELLSDNPVHEGRPNVLAVGDDDQAIYAFQGAQYSNMYDFSTMYRDVTLVNLKKNYRSHADVLTVAGNIAAQIKERLHHKFEGTTKDLIASNPKIPTNAHIVRNDFISDIAQYDWIARKIRELIDNGTSPKEIAILAPRHKQLEPVVPFLNALNVPVRYEKRENILEAPIVKQLTAMSRLLLAIKSGDRKSAEALWPEVLSFDFWKIPTQTIWQLSWDVADKHDESYDWNRAVLANEQCRTPAQLLLTLAGKADIETLETMLDWLIGTVSVETNDLTIPTIQSPLRDFYMSTTVLKNNPQLFYETLSHLRILRDKLRAFQKNHDEALMLSDLIAFIDMHTDANEQIINTSPYNQDTDAVQIMTAFKAKGLEYEHVFLVSCLDDVWGARARGNTNKLVLPPNLMPIRHAGSTDDERLRILFVALTRAKFGLYMTSYTQTYLGKATERLSYFDEQVQDDGSFMAMVLPDDARHITHMHDNAPAQEHLELNWRTRHTDGLNLANLRGLLEDRLQTYKLSPTHVNTFTDLEYGGPSAFFFKTLLRFPEAPTLANQFGNAMHSTLEWLQHQVDIHGATPHTEDVLMEFSRQLQKQKLPEQQKALEHERGEKALAAYINQRAHIFKPGDKAEHDFGNEAVVIGNVHMRGKIDRMEIDKDKKEIIVVDYKTGKSYDRWKNDTKLHKYRQQLYCYKLLIENSRTFAGYTVTAGRLEFLEPDDDGSIHSIEHTFMDDEVENTKKLISSIWHHVHNLSFPDTSQYEPTYKGILEFENDLMSKGTFIA